MAKKRAREADGTTEAPDKMVEDSDSSDDEVSMFICVVGNEVLTSIGPGL